MSADSAAFSGPAEVTHGSVTIASNTETPEQIREAMGVPPEEQEISDAAGKLGKKGAEARKAKKEAEEAEEEPEAKPAEKTPAKDEDEPEEAPEKKAKAEEPKEKKPGRVEKLQGEIARLVAERRTEEERLAKLKQEREAVEKPAPKAAKPDEDPEPDFEDSERYPEGRFDPKYTKDLVDHGIRQGLKTERERLAKEAEESQRVRTHEARAQSFTDRMEKATEDPEFAARLKAIPENPEARQIVVDLLKAVPFDLVPKGEARGPLNLIKHWLLDSPIAPYMTVALAEQHEDFRKLFSLSPDGLYRTLARLEARIAQEIEPQERPAPATAGTGKEPAPWKPPSAPLRPVKSSAHADSDELDDNAPLSVHVARFAQRELAARSR